MVLRNCKAAEWDKDQRGNNKGKTAIYLVLHGEDGTNTDRL